MGNFLKHVLPLLILHALLGGASARLVSLEDRLWIFNSRDNTFSVAWSQDAYRWQGVTIFDQFFDVAYGKGKYVVIGTSKGYPLIPYLIPGAEELGFAEVPDIPEYVSGTNWGLLRGVAFGSGRFVVVGDKGVVLVSEDGERWRRVNPGVEEDLMGVVFTRGRFVAAGKDSSILLSEDGLRWQRIRPQRPLFYELSALHLVNGRIFALDWGTLFVSVDGRDWEQVDLNSDEDLRGIAYGKGTYVLVSKQSIFVSSDGNRWAKVILPPELAADAQREFHGVAYFKGQFIVRASSSSFEEAFLKSVDGKSWGIHRTGFETLRSVAYGNGTFVAVGERGTALVSRDGETWTPVELGTWASLYEVVFIGEQNRFFAYGWGDVVVTSRDGRSWERRHLRPQNAEWITVERVYRIVYGNGVYLALAQGEGGQDEDGTPKTLRLLLSSKDGRSWSLIKVFEEEFWGLAYGQGLFLGAHYVRTEEQAEPERASNLVASRDGVNWNRTGILWGGLWPQGLYSVAGKFLVIAGDYIYVSDDGVRWTMANFTDKTDTDLLELGDYSFDSVIYTGDQFAMLGWDNMGLYGTRLTGGVLALSKDALYWIVYSISKERGNRDLIESLTEMLAIAYGQGKFVGVGSAHTIWISMDGLKWKKVR